MFGTGRCGARQSCVEASEEETEGKQDEDFLR